MSNTDLAKLLILGLLMLSTAFHEMAHAYVATWLGDPTPGRAGRLTLNPIPHLSPVLTAIILPTIMFMRTDMIIMLATTPIDPTRFRKPLRDRALVAVAGPITNVICAAVLLGVLWWMPGINDSDNISRYALVITVRLNLLFAIFNLLPLPPLDGYWIFRAGLPLSTRMKTDAFASSPYCWIVVFALGSFIVDRIYPYVTHFVELIRP